MTEPFYRTGEWVQHYSTVYEIVESFYVTTFEQSPNGWYYMLRAREGGPERGWTHESDLQRVSPLDLLADL